MNALADQQVDLIYRRDPLSIEALDEASIAADLFDGPGGCETHAGWSQRLIDYDHLMIAVDKRGRTVGMVAALDGKTTHEEFLLIDAVFTRPDHCDSRLTRRMLAAMILRVAGLSSAPSVIATCTDDQACMTLFRTFDRRFQGAARYPQPDGEPIFLRSAALAQRVAKSLYPYLRFDTASGIVRGASAARRLQLAAGSKQAVDFRRPAEMGARCLQRCDKMLMLIDLRTESEQTIIDDARRIYRGR